MIFHAKFVETEVLVNIMAFMHVTVAVGFSREVLGGTELTSARIEAVETVQSIRHTVTNAELAG